MEGDRCCKIQSSFKACSGAAGTHTPAETAADELAQIVDPKLFKPYDSSQEPIFPPELMVGLEFHFIVYSNTRRIYSSHGFCLPLFRVVRAIKSYQTAAGIPSAALLFRRRPSH